MISTILASSKAATDIARGIISLDKGVAVNEKAYDLINVILDLQQHILTAQSEYQKLLVSHDEWKKKAEQRIKWAETANLYQLHTLMPGVFVYKPKEGCCMDEPPHYICSNCYGQEKKAILQFNGCYVRGTEYLCHVCEKIIIDRSQKMPPPNNSGW